MLSSDVRPIFFGCSGLALTDAEHDFFAECQPLGFVLFQRNCQNPEQIKALVQQLRAAVERLDAPIFIDQEGGRVARLKPPHWLKLPDMRMIGELYEKDANSGSEAMRLHAKLTAYELQPLGINGNFAPVIDLFVEGASEAIGDRAFSGNPQVVAALGKVAIETYLANGILPVIKHMPGHGRVKADPHYELPVVNASIEQLAEADFIPFQLLRDAPLAMNCHVLFTALDADRPVSLSPEVHQEIIRSSIGFKGMLFSDDLAMKALKGSLPEIAKQALSAGADILLHCTGNLDEMRDIISGVPLINAGFRQNWLAVCSHLGLQEPNYRSEADYAAFAWLMDTHKVS